MSESRHALPSVDVNNALPASSHRMSVSHYVLVLVRRSVINMDQYNIVNKLLERNSQLNTAFVRRRRKLEMITSRISPSSR